MLSEEMLKMHDQLEKRATSRPWTSLVRRRPGYGDLVFWSRRQDLEIMFDNIHDVRYLAFVRNIAPEMVHEIRTLRQTIVELKDKIVDLQLKLLEFEERTKDG